MPDDRHDVTRELSDETDKVLAELRAFFPSAQVFMRWLVESNAGLQGTPGRMLAYATRPEHLNPFREMLYRIGSGEPN